MKPISKTIKSREELYIDFTEKELAELGWQAGDKLSWEVTDKGDILLKKYVTLDIDLNEFSKDDLISIIQASTIKGLTVDEFIQQALEDTVRELKNEENCDDIESFRKEYEDLKERGLLWEKYPNCSGDWGIDYSNYLEYVDEVYEDGSPRIYPISMKEWFNCKNPPSYL